MTEPPRYPVPMRAAESLRLERILDVHIRVWRRQRRLAVKSGLQPDLHDANIRELAAILRKLRFTRLAAQRACEPRVPRRVVPALEACP